MKMLKSIAFSALLLGGVAAQAQSVDDVLATVNGTDITLGDVLVARTQLPPQYQQLPNEALYEGLLNQVIQQHLLSETVTDMSPRLKLAIQSETRSLRAGEALSAVTEGAITDEALRAEYERQYADQDLGLEYNAAHILLETEEKAQEMVAELENGADFAALAQEHSTGPSGPSGGDLGWFAKGVMVPAFEEAVIAMEPGAISAPVETQFGWHVIKLADTRAVEAPSFDEVSGQIAEELRQNAIAAHIEKLTSDAEITMTEGVDPAVIGNMDLLGQ